MLYKLLKFIFILLILINTLCCKNYKTKQVLKELYKKQIIIPEEIIFLYNDSIFTNDKFDLFNKENKIITYISGECGKCVENLNKWTSIVDSFKRNDDISFLFFIYTSNVDYFKKIYYPKLKINYPLIIDTKDLFYKNNELYKNDNIHFYTFLVNKENKILLVGSPIFNDRIKKTLF